jgi:hypothetical protein
MQNAASQVAASKEGASLATSRAPKKLRFIESSRPALGCCEATIHTYGIFFVARLNSLRGTLPHSSREFMV